MNSVSELLSGFSDQGVVLSLDEGGGLTIDAPEGVLTQQVIDEVRARKPDLVAALQTQPYTGKTWLRELVDDLLAAGAELGLQDGRAVAVPGSALSPRAVATIEARQAELVETLTAVAQPIAGDWLKTTRLGGGTFWLRAGDEHLTADLDIDHTADISEDAVCRYGSTQWRDTLLHDGQSTRRDCGQCGRFLGFSIWYGHQGPARLRGWGGLSEGCSKPNRPTRAVAGLTPPWRLGVGLSTSTRGQTMDEFECTECGETFGIEDDAGDGECRRCVAGNAEDDGGEGRGFDDVDELDAEMFV